MIDKTKLRYTVIIFLFLSLTALACAFTARENSTCLGVKIAKTPQPQNRQEIFVNLGDLFFSVMQKRQFQKLAKPYTFRRT